MKISVKYSTMIVENTEKSVEFYENVLGFTKGYHVEVGDCKITLMNSPDGGTVELIENPALPVGFWSIGNDVDNLNEVIAHLDECGIEHTPVVTTTVGHMCFITDPNGVKICLMEHDIKAI